MTTLSIYKKRGNINAQDRAIYTFTSLPYRRVDNLGESRQLRYGSAAASAEGRRRAFRRGAAILYLHQDHLTTFATLTYRHQHKDYSKILNDFKNYFSRRNISYLAVVEAHKSGNLHIHAITSDLPDVYKSEFFTDGRPQYKWRPWESNLGITDIQFLTSMDDHFRIERYIFKYMNKSVKIGGRYFLKSRDLTIDRLSSYRQYGDIQSMPFLFDDDDIEFQESRCYNGDGYNLSVERIYYAK